MKARIALLTNYPPDYASFSGGVETATAALLEGLRSFQDQFEFHVITVSNAIPDDVVEPHDGFCFHFLSVPHHPLMRPRFPFRTLKTYRTLRRIEPALIHCHDNMALALAAIYSGYPRVFTVHGVKRHEARKRSGWEFWSALTDALFEGYVHGHFDAFICISQYAARVIGGGRPTFAIPNAISSEFFQTYARPKATNPILLFAGVLDPLKRPGDLLAAHAVLQPDFPGLETIFCGKVQDAGYFHAMQRSIRENGLKGVRFEGRVGQARLAELLGEASALVLPSSQENAPMVIAEAMAAGVPVVATRVGGIPDMIRHGETGLLYPVGDIPELAHCLRRLLLEPDLQARLAQQAQEFARATYSPSRVAKATVAAYEQMLRQPARMMTERTHA